MGVRSDLIEQETAITFACLRSGIIRWNRAGEGGFF